MLSPLIYLLLGFMPLATQASLVANLDIPAKVAAQYGCKGACYKNFQAGLAADREFYGAIYDDDFYATASNFSSSKPGDVLKFKPINASLLTDIPEGTAAYKLQYVSKDLYGRKVPATGFIAFPYATRRNDHKFPLIAYAHGTSGVFRGCAPSAMPNLYDYNSWSLLIRRGYAVVATDYAGLGNNYTSHQYQASPAQANDVYYSIVAARKLFGASLTSEWMSVGHSQGGGAAWALAESPLLRQNCPVGKYLGTVAQAPGVRLKEMAIAALESDSSSDVTSSRGVLGEVGWVIIGLRSILPKDRQNWLKPAFRKRLELATLAQACYASAQALVSDLGVEDIVDFTDPGFLKAINAMQNFTARGEGKSQQPILVVQGLNDVSVLPEVVEESYRVGCRSRNELHLELYPGMDHDPVIAAASPYFLQWIDDRFAGVTTSGKCTNHTTQPFDAVNMYAPDDTD
ncbi:hypothetical protein FOMG_04520 [Fusarium oxysporum f. sp. melonis 26406]|uniref:Serine aminopeptidase S33 domain-containing protein n=1 Tax=Fusarium oxysporum f. sp. melonis 26406 TaxID=1089452 RepID=X0ABB4_FUSOX|nr:hypothetical protein FOMG_04520 [Fusarium oxysporum f. sp. melonis 26406]